MCECLDKSFHCRYLLKICYIPPSVRIQLIRPAVHARAIIIHEWLVLATVANNKINYALRKPAYALNL